MPDPIVFKTEDSLWQMLKDGTKTWDARKYDMSDDRIYRLSFGHWRTKLCVKTPAMLTPTLPLEIIKEAQQEKIWVPEEELVYFRNKKTNEALTFRYIGIEFAPWAPGWCFILLGEVEEA